MKRKILAILLAFSMIFTLTPQMSIAADGVPMDQEAITGTAYISISDDADYVTSDGQESGKIMAYVPVDLAEVSKVDLDDYDLGQFKYDPDGDGKNQVTLLHMYLYVLDKYYSGTASELQITGSPGSLYMKNGFWGHDENLTYYVNGQYPLEREAWGATADHIILADGDFADVTMYTDWSFWTDSKAGYHYFVDKNNAITHKYTATQGIDTEIKYTYAKTDWNASYSTSYVAEPDSTVYYSKILYDNNPRTVVTDSEGKAKINFPEAGEWHLWTKGQPGENVDAIVSSPSYASVTVEPYDGDPSLKEIGVGQDTIAVTADKDVYEKEVKEEKLDSQGSILIKPTPNKDGVKVEMLEGEEYKTVPAEGVKVKLNREATNTIKFKVTDLIVSKEYTLNINVLAADLSLNSLALGENNVELEANKDSYDVSVKRKELDADNSILLKALAKNAEAKTSLLVGEEYQEIPESGMKVKLNPDQVSTLKIRVSLEGRSKDYTVNASVLTPDTTISQIQLGENKIEALPDKDTYDLQVKERELDQDSSMLIKVLPNKQGAKVEILENGEYKLIPAEGLKLKLDKQAENAIKFKVTDYYESKEYTLNVNVIDPDVSLNKIMVGDNEIQGLEGQTDYSVNINSSQLDQDKSILVKVLPNKQDAELSILEGETYKDLSAEGIKIEMGPESKTLKFKISDDNESMEYLLKINMDEDESPVLESLTAGPNTIMVEQDKDNYTSNIASNQIDENGNINIVAKPAKDNYKVYIYNDELADYELLPAQGKEISFKDVEKLPVKIKLVNGFASKEYSFELVKLYPDETLKSLFFNAVDARIQDGKYRYNVDIDEAALINGKDLRIKSTANKDSARIAISVNGSNYQDLSKAGYTYNMENTDKAIVRLRVFHMGSHKTYIAFVNLKRKPVRKHWDIGKYPIRQDQLIKLPTPNGEDRSQIEWKVYDSSVARLGADGRVRGLKLGVTRVRATIVQGHITKTFDYYIPVAPARPENFKVERHGETEMIISSEIPEGAHGILVYRAKGAGEFEPFVRIYAKGQTSVSAKYYLRSGDNYYFYARAFSSLRKYTRNSEGLFRFDGSQNYYSYRSADTPKIRR